jgi:hypothetical protein
LYSGRAIRPGHVGGRADPGRDRGLGGVAVEPDHRRHGVLKYFAGLLLPVVEQADTDRLGQGERQPGRGGIVARQPLGVGHTGHRHAVLGFRVGDLA